MAGFPSPSLVSERKERGGGVREGSARALGS